MLSALWFTFGGMLIVGEAIVAAMRIACSELKQDFIVWAMPIIAGLTGARLVLIGAEKWMQG